MIKVASDLMDSISNYVKDHPEMLTGLLAGGGIGAIGGALGTGPDSEEDDESAGSRIGKRLKNALLGAAVGGAAGGGIGYALGANGPFRSPLPDGDESPEMAAITSIPGRGIAAALGFGLGRYGDNKARASLQEKFLESLADGSGNVPKSFAAVESSINAKPTGEGGRWGTNILDWKRKFETNHPGATAKAFVDAAERAGMNIDERALHDGFPHLASKVDIKGAFRDFHPTSLLTEAGRKDFSSRISRFTGDHGEKTWDTIVNLYKDRALRNKLLRNRMGLIGAGAGALAPELWSALSGITGISTDFTAPLH